MCLCFGNMETCSLGNRQVKNVQSPQWPMYFCLINTESIGINKTFTALSSHFSVAWHALHYLTTATVWLSTCMMPVMALIICITKNDRIVRVWVSQVLLQKSK